MLQAWLTDKAVTLTIPDDIAGFEGVLQAIAAFESLFFERGMATIVLERGASPKAQGRVFSHISTWFLVADELMIDGETYRRLATATIMAVKVVDRLQVAIENHHWATAAYVQEVVAKLRNAYQLTDQTPQAKTETAPAEPRGPNAGTEAKVREAHKRLTAGEKWATVVKVCAHETYMRWCYFVTGEEPKTK